MFDEFQDIRSQVARELGHWTQAALRLSKLDEQASKSSWDGLERYLNVALRSSLNSGLASLGQNARDLQNKLDRAQTIPEVVHVQGQLGEFKKRYLRTETMLDFYADAINTRTNEDMVALMRACDRIASASMNSILTPMGKSVPPVLTYIDKGLGASILKAGLRLWDGRTSSPAAAIKIVRHNLYRPTALIHEAGHQVAHILNWNEELAGVLAKRLKPLSAELSDTWSGWASEIAADTFAFVHTGYASIAGLHDVVSGDSKFVFRFLPFDPHPISFLRVLLGIAMCRICYGKGPWDQMERVWKQNYRISDAEVEVQELLRHSLKWINEIGRICLDTPMNAFRGKPITYWIKPKNVGPKLLSELVKKAGASLYRSPHWIASEPVRLLALGGYKIATSPNQVSELLQQQRQWMLKLGNGLRAA